MVFARRVFTFVAIYGIVVLTPMLFLEKTLGEQFPPAPNHPELFYGFLLCALVWQLVYLTIGRDPERYRPLMIHASLAKLSFGSTCALLYLIGRAPLATFLTAAPDLVFAGLYLECYRRTAGLTRSAMAASLSPTA